MPEIVTTELPGDGRKPPPAVVRSARRKHKRSESPPSRAQTAPNLPEVELGAPMTPLPGYIRLPSPPKFSMDPNTFFKYWADVDLSFPNRGIVYVYRTWPRIDRQKIDPEAYKYSDKMDRAFEDPALWRQEMLHRYGSGNYKLILNDAGGGTKSVGQTMISDLRDSDYPPVIENMDELVMDDPTNQSFIESLRQKGLMPGENALLQAETTEALTGTIDKLTTKLIERKPEPAQAQTAGAADTAKAAMDMARDVFKQGMDLGQETVRAQADAVVAKAKAEADAVSAKATAATEAQNPAQSLGMLTQLIDLVQKITPKPSELAHANPAQDLTGLITSLMNRADNMQTAMMAMLQQQIKDLSAARTAPAQASGESKPDDFMSNLEKMIGMKKRLQEFLGVTGGADSDEPEREEKTPVWMQLAGKAFDALPTIAMQGVAMTHNLAVARTGQGVPLGPGAMPAVEAPAGMEGVQPNPQSQPQTQGEPMNPIILGMLKQIERPFLTFLNDPEKSGADFAEALMGLYGRTGYDVIRERGKETVTGWLLAYPPIGQVISQIPERASQFLDDFMNADAILASEQAEDEPGAAFVQGEPGG